MKKGFFLYLSFLVVFLLFSGEVFSQKVAADTGGGRNPQTGKVITIPVKKAGESIPVPNTTIVVEQVSPSEIIIPTFKLRTNDKGEFALVLTSEQFRRLPNEFQLRFTIKPMDPSKFPVDTNTVVVKLKKPPTPNLEFVLTWQLLDARTNKGCFAVKSKAQA